MLFLLFSGLASALPAMVTTSIGDVQLQSSPDPAPPYLFHEGQSLSIPSNGRATLLYEGVALSFTGPKTVPYSQLKVPSRGKTDAFNGLLGHPPVETRAGASRGVPSIQLLRPIPDRPLIALHAIQWSCGACAEQPVVLTDLMSGAQLWTSTGTEHLNYSGPALTEGLYLLSIGSSEFPFSVEDAPAPSLSTSDPIDSVALNAGILLHAGFFTDALYAIDAGLERSPNDPQLSALLSEAKRRAGVAH